jgi:hypothetical protein
VFGDKEGKESKAHAVEAADAAMLAEVERMEALPTIQMATEVMAKGFGPGGPADAVPPAAPGASIRSIKKVFDRADSTDSALQRRLYDLVADSVQVLEHASLVRPEGVVGEQQGLAFYSLTRRGRAALEHDAVERVLHGEAL